MTDMNSAMHDVAKRTGTLHPCIRLRHEIVYEYWNDITVNENTINQGVLVAFCAI